MQVVIAIGLSVNAKRLKRFDRGLGLRFLLMIPRPGVLNFALGGYEERKLSVIRRGG